MDVRPWTMGRGMRAALYALDAAAVIWAGDFVFSVALGRDIVLPVLMTVLSIGIATVIKREETL